MKQVLILTSVLCLLGAVLLAGGVYATGSVAQPRLAASEAMQGAATPTPGHTIRITSFQLSATPGGPPTNLLPTGSQVVYIDFRFQNGTNDRVTVEVRDEFGNSVFREEGIYSGNGRTSLQLTGQMVYQSYWQASGPAGANLLQAIGVTRGAGSLPELRQRLSETVGLAVQFRSLITQLLRYPLDTPARQALIDALAALDQAIDKGEQGLNPILTEAEVRALVDEMATLASDAISAVSVARGLAGDGVGFAILPTLGGANVANLYVNGDLVQTIEWRVVAPEPTQTPTLGPGTPPATPVPTETGLPTTTPTVTRTPTATPTPSTIAVDIVARPRDTGYVVSRDWTTNHLGDPNMYTGEDKLQPKTTIFHGIVQFDLSSLPQGAQIVAAQVELTGLSTKYLNGTGGTWRLDLLGSSVDMLWFQLGYWQIHNAPVELVVPPVLTDADLGPGVTNVFVFTPAQLAALQARLSGTGKASFRLDGAIRSTVVRHIFDWDSGHGHPDAQAPVLHVVYRQAAPSVFGTGQ